MPANRIIIFFLLSLLNGGSIPAQSQTAKLEYDLSVRYRFEAWNGMNAKNYGYEGMDASGDLNDRFLLQRFITGINWSPLPNLKFAFHVQDSRAFGWSLRDSKYPGIFRVHEKGQESPYYVMNPNEAFFEMSTAYIEYQRLFGQMDITIGRQKINYGDNRIFGPGEWGNTGRWTWDAVKFTYNHAAHSVDVFAGGTKTHNPHIASIPFTQTEFWGGGMYAQFEFSTGLQFEPFYAYKMQGSAAYINTKRISRHWTGFRFHYHPLQVLLIDVTLAKQLGHEQDKEIDAWGGVAKLAYQKDYFLGRLLIGLRQTYATGAKVESSKNHQFEPAFGANDRYYGRMNIARWSNIDDRELFLEFETNKGLRLEFTYHFFYIPEPHSANLVPPLQIKESKHHLGNELNIFVRYQLAKNLELTGVFGYFVPGQLENINGSPPHNASWFALQLFLDLQGN